jgi:hypothetical protein
MNLWVYCKFENKIRCWSCKSWFFWKSKSNVWVCCKYENVEVANLEISGFIWWIYEHDEEQSKEKDEEIEKKISW